MPEENVIAENTENEANPDVEKVKEELTKKFSGLENDEIMAQLYTLALDRADRIKI
jgi:hypothetical protein